MRAHRIPVAVLVVAIPTWSAACGGSAFSTDSGSEDSGVPDSSSGELDSSSGDGLPVQEDCSSRCASEGGTDGPSRESGASEAGGPDGNAADASPWSPDCPTDPPTAGTPCTQPQLQCEYGDAWWSVSCDVVMECQGGQWGNARPSFEPCSAQPGPNSSQCAATFADVPRGSSCSPAGFTCRYPQGQCSCQLPLGGPVLIDGGSASWGCLPGTGCPYPRLRLGVACSSDGKFCTYEACSYGQSCQGGVWQAQPEVCE